MYIAGRPPQVDNRRDQKAVKLGLQSQRDNSLYCQSEAKSAAVGGVQFLRYRVSVNPWQLELEVVWIKDFGVTS